MAKTEFAIRAEDKNEVVTQPETAVFYSWMGWDDREKRAYPSCQIIHISGGSILKATDGSPIRVSVKEARFHNGVFTTDDPETIRELRKISSRAGTCVTENREEFYGATMSMDQRSRRSVVLANQQQQKIDESSREISRLRQFLESKGVKDTAAA